MRPTLTITRGLPASGKTTLARTKVHLREVLLASLFDDELPQVPNQIARVNRDDLRAMLHVDDWTAAKEAATRAARDAAIGALLLTGWDVICDDTHLRGDEVLDMRALVLEHDATLEIMDLRFVPIEECIRRDSLRQNPVGQAVIERLAAVMEADLTYTCCGACGQPLERGESRSHVCDLDPEAEFRTRMQATQDDTLLDRTGSVTPVGHHQEAPTKKDVQ